MNSEYVIASLRDYYGIDVQSIEPLVDRKRSITFRARSENSSFIVKVLIQSEDIVEAKCRLFQEAAQVAVGVLVSSPVRTLVGNCACHMGEKSLAVFRDDTVTKAEATIESLRVWGQSAARIEQAFRVLKNRDDTASLRRYGETPFSIPIYKAMSSFRKYVATQEHWGSFLSNHKDHIGDLADDLQTDAQRYGERNSFCHGDLNPTNMLLTKRGCLIIDPDCIHWGPEGYDLAYLLLTGLTMFPSGFHPRIVMENYSAIGTDLAGLDMCWMRVLFAWCIIKEIWLRCWLGWDPPSSIPFWEERSICLRALA